MTQQVSSQRTEFPSGGIRCTAWLTSPDGAGPHPAVVLVHGLGATHDMMLAQYEQHFAAAGIATLGFDYRHMGKSDGRPRQRVSLPRQRADVHAALDFLRRRPDVDATRMGLWGTSLGAMHVVRVAADRSDVAAAVVQCPIVHGPGAVRHLGLREPLLMTPAIAEDAIRVVLRRGRRYVPIVGPPRTRAVVTAEGAEAGWNSTVPTGGGFDNRMPAADALALMAASSLRRAHEITAPLLVCVCDRENLIDPRYAISVAEQAARGVTRHYDSDHFAIYHPPLVGRVLADQTAFFVEHLRVSA